MYPVISATADATLPRLAWVASLNRTSGTLRVRHGAGVEVGTTYCVEGVWDGRFEDMGFHGVEHFFGSGVRVDGEEVHFVPSCAHVDRLLYAEDGFDLVVSNSLPLILIQLGAALRPGHSYISESHAITAGIFEYRKEIPVAHPHIPVVHQLYHSSLVVSGDSMEARIRSRDHAFDEYDSYRMALDQALRRIGDNMDSPARKHPLPCTATVSSGYDSPAVAVLTRAIGLHEVYTSQYSNSGVPVWLSHAAAVDDGTPIATQLGLCARPLTAARAVGQEEIYFSASGTSAPELIFHSLFRSGHDSERPAVLFSGYYGDTVWGTTTPEDLREGSMRWPAISGLALSEARLWAGLIHVPVPFLYARSIASIHSITQSAEMDRWRLGNDYDRPIPRRIVEEAGIERNAFGVRKKAVVQHYRIPYNRVLREDFLRFITEQGESVWRMRQRALTDRVFTILHGASDAPTVLLHRWAVDRLCVRLNAALSTRVRPPA